MVQLRQLVDAAVEGLVEFNAEFAAKTCQEVVSAYGALQSQKQRRIVGWATTASDYIPMAGPILHKVIDEIATGRIDAKRQRNYGFFFSELAW